MHELLIGTYTQHGSAGIYRLSFDDQRGWIDPAPLQIIPSANPSWLILNRAHDRLYAANENAPGDADPVGRVSSFAIDAASGALRPINQVMTLGDEPTHLSLSADERYLLVANYGSRANPGGSLALLPLRADGGLAPVTQLGIHPPSGADPARQSAPHVHAVLPAPDGQRVYACDLGADRLFSYDYDPANAERPLRPAEPAWVALPAGSGPRHLVFSASGRQAFLTLELSAQLARFACVGGDLQLRQLIDLAAPGETARHSPAAVHPSADGRFLYVSDRGEANRILVYAIDPDDGHLREIQRRSSEGREPREFCIAPDGRFLLIANQLSDALLVLQRDPQTGLLGDTLQQLALSRPSAIVFLAR